MNRSQRAGGMGSGGWICSPWWFGEPCWMLNAECLDLVMNPLTFGDLCWKILPFRTARHSWVPNSQRRQPFSARAVQRAFRLRAVCRLETRILAARNLSFEEKISVMSYGYTDTPAKWRKKNLLSGFVITMVHQRHTPTKGTNSLFCRREFSSLKTFFFFWIWSTLPPIIIKVENGSFQVSRFSLCNWVIYGHFIQWNMSGNGKFHQHFDTSGI